MGKKNPIARRLEALGDQWAEFALDADARLLCWLFAPDEVRMADAFLAAEADERAGSHPDVFLTLQAPFENPHGHGYSLIEELGTGYDAGRAALEKQGLPADWVASAAPARPQNDITWLIERCQSFIAHHGLTRFLVLVLRPSAVSEPAAYQAWLSRLCAAAPENLRILVFDYAEAPAFAALVAGEQKRVRARHAALDMSSALEEISRDAGHMDSPGGQFRHLFVKLGSALKAQDLERAQQLGAAALGIATSQGWWHVAVPVHFALAAGLTGAQRLQEAMAEYVAAEATAARGESEGAEEARAACKTMRMQARLGSGSVLVAARAWSEAARHYASIAPLAAALGDAPTVLDCHRLTAFAHEQDSKPDQAFRAANEGLRVAREMDPKVRATSTFPYLAESLMRLTRTTPELRTLEAQTEREIVAIAGTRDWRPKQPGTAAAS
jgi:hypothetical protein